MFNRILLLLFLSSLISVSVDAMKRQIEISATVHTDKLSVEEREYWEGVDYELNRVLNDTRWFNTSTNEIIPISVEIILERSVRSAAHRRCSAGIMVGTPKGIQLRDRRWDFAFNKDRPISFGEVYDSFAGPIEFYVLISLGFEMDLKSPLGGQVYYEQARQVAENARFEIEYYLGWDKRRDLAWALVSDVYSNVRKAGFHLESAISLIDLEDFNAAESHLMRVVELITALNTDQLELKRDDHIIRFVSKVKLLNVLDVIDDEELWDLVLEWDPTFLDNDDLAD